MGENGKRFEDLANVGHHLFVESLLLRIASLATVYQSTVGCTVRSCSGRPFRLTDRLPHRYIDVVCGGGTTTHDARAACYVLRRSFGGRGCWQATPGREGGHRARRADGGGVWAAKASLETASPSSESHAFASRHEVRVELQCFEFGNCDWPRVLAVYAAAAAKGHQRFGKRAMSMEPVSPPQALGTPHRERIANAMSLAKSIEQASVCQYLSAACRRDHRPGFFE